MNFSIAGDTSIEMALPDTFVSVTTAFGTGADGFARASDVIADGYRSKASIEHFWNRSRRLPVVNAQYGVSLEDVGTGFTALAQLGIKGTAAVLRFAICMRTCQGVLKKVAKLLKQQGIEMRDAATGGFGSRCRDR